MVVAGTAAYSANQQRGAARDAARTQARGVEQAQQETRAAVNRARNVLTGVSEPVQQTLTQINNQNIERDNLARELEQLEGRRSGRGFNALQQQRIEQLRSQIASIDSQIAQSQSLAQSQQATNQSADTPITTDGQPQGAQVDLGPPDPRGELISGILGQLAFTGQGFAGAQETISPLAAMAAPYLQQQSDILGLGGEEARQQAISQISDPLVAAQERAILRNNAALGGVGGNVLSTLAEQTRARTEANIGDRLAQLGRASSPALNALQNISNLRLNQGLSMADIMGVGGRDLSAQETARRQALANLELGQGSELAQLAQNLGTARAGGAAFAAQSPSPLAAGLTAGLGAYTGAGGAFGGFDGNANTAMNVQNPNIYGNIT